MSAKFDRDLLGHQPEPAPKVQVFPRNVTSMPRLSATNSVTCRSQREGIVCPENTDSGAFGSCCWERIKTPLHKNILDWNETTAPGEFQKLECVLRLGYCLGVGCTVLDPPCVLQKGHKTTSRKPLKIQEWAKVTWHVGSASLSSTPGQAMLVQRSSLEQKHRNRWHLDQHGRISNDLLSLSSLLHDPGFV